MPHSIQDSEDSRGYIPNKSHNGPNQRKPTLSPEGTPSSESDDQDDDAYIDEDASTSSGGLPDEALDEEQDEIKQSSSSGLDDLELHRRNRMKQAWQIYYQVFTQLRRHAEKQKFLRKKKQPGQNDFSWNLTKRPSGKRLARLKLTRCMEILAESQELYGDSVQRSAGNHNLDIHTPSTQPDRPSRDAVSNIEVPLDTDRAHTFSRYESEIPSASDHKVPIHRQNLDARKRTSTSRVSPGNKLSGSRRTRIPWPRREPVTIRDSGAHRQNTSRVLRRSKSQPKRAPKDVTPSLVASVKHRRMSNNSRNAHLYSIAQIERPAERQISHSTSQPSRLIRSTSRREALSNAQPSQRLQLTPLRPGSSSSRVHSSTQPERGREHDNQPKSNSKGRVSQSSFRKFNFITGKWNV